MFKPTEEEKEKGLTKKALEYIKQGNLKDAENIYRGLISTGTKNHVVYSNYAVICGQKGYQQEKIELLKSYNVAEDNLTTVYLFHGFLFVNEDSEQTFIFAEF